ALVKDNSILSRLTNVSLADSTIQSRLILWQSAWQAWQARPLLGFGPENFEAATGKYLSPRLAGFEAYGTDRSHNFIFDYGVAGGWLGLLSYLVMIAAAGWALVKNFLWCHPEGAAATEGSIKDSSSRQTGTQNDDRDKPQDDKVRFLFSVIFLSLLVAYLIQNFFIFDSFVSYLMLFFVLALINFYSKKSICHPERSEGSILDSSATPQNDKKKNSHLEHIRSAQYKLREGSLNVVKKIGLVFFAIFIISALYLFNLKSILAAYRANQILSLPLENVAQAAPLLKDALSFNTFASPEIAYQAAIDYIDKISQNPVLAQDEEFYNAAAGELAKIIERSPNRTRNYIALAWLDLYFSSQDSSRINEAINLGNKIKELSPNKKDAYLILVAGYALSGQADKAQEVISWALVIDGKMGEEVKAYWEKIR
ncbi:O-antigen ligase family protein, partial [Patescibacteria group bacterium]|nr:O-antigen ligase family protein [Patescibacteria group bacterium]